MSQDTHASAVTKGMSKLSPHVQQLNDDDDVEKPLRSSLGNSISKTNDHDVELYVMWLARKALNAFRHVGRRPGQGEASSSRPASAIPLARPPIIPRGAGRRCVDRRMTHHDTGEERRGEERRGDERRGDERRGGYKSRLV